MEIVSRAARTPIVAPEPTSPSGLRARMQAHAEVLRSRPAPNESSLPGQISLAGVTFEGRQSSLAKARLGDPIRFLRRPTNPHDTKSIEALSRDGSSLGWVPKEIAAHLAPRMDAGMQVDGSVSAVVGGTETGLSLGLRVALTYREVAEWRPVTPEASSTRPAASDRNTPRSSRRSSFDDGEQGDPGDYDNHDEDGHDDREPQEDETAEGLGVGDIEFGDCDSEY